MKNIVVLPSCVMIMSVYCMYSSDLAQHIHDSSQMLGRRKSVCPVIDYYKQFASMLSEEQAKKTEEELRVWMRQNPSPTIEQAAKKKAEICRMAVEKSQNKPAILVGRRLSQDAR